MASNRDLAYRTYINVLEHLLVLEGAFPRDDRVYLESWLKHDAYEWLEAFSVKLRERLALLE